MKFLICTNHSYMLWQFRRELIETLQGVGDVVISMPFVGHEDDFTALGCRCMNTHVDRRGLNPVADFKLYRTYKRLLKAENPDIVITYSIKPNIYAGFACKMRNIPYCVNVQGLGTAFQKTGLAQLVLVMYRAALADARVVFFENRNSAEAFTARGIISKEKAMLLKGAGVNLAQYAFQLYPEDGTIHFLYIGRIMKEKGVDELLAAIEKLYVEYGTRIVLDMVGFFEEAYEKKIHQLQKDGIVMFHGFQEEPRPYYGSAHCIVLPSYHEGMSNVLLEASACGRPIIASDIPGCREAVEDGQTGYLCRAKDQASLYAKMKQFVELCYEKKREMGGSARQKMEREFDRLKVVEMTVAAIRGT